MKNPIFENSVHALQLKSFGPRFVGATLSHCSMYGTKNVLIQQFMEKRKNFLVLTGVSGCGKTHIAASMVEWMIPNFRSIRIWKEYELMKTVKMGIEKGFDPSDTLERLVDDEVLVIDDLGSQGHNEWREKMMFEMIDMRYTSRKPTIFTTNLSKGDFYKMYDRRIASRLFAAENTVIDLSDASDLREQGM